MPVNKLPNDPQLPKDLQYRSFVPRFYQLWRMLKNWSDEVAAEVESGSDGTDGTGDLSVYGRLTLSSGVPVTTSDVTGATTVYFAPYKGNSLPLYVSSAWVQRTFSETSLALGTITNNKNYDVFGYDNAGTLALEMLAWTNDTTRATGLTTQDGRLVKSGDATRLYLGTFRTTSTTTTEDSGGGSSSQVGGKRFLWNYYNRARAHCSVVDTTVTWAYGTDTIRQANNASGNKIEFVCGVAEDSIEAEVKVTIALGGNTTVWARAGIGLDSTTTFVGLVQGGFSGAGTTDSGMLGGSYRGIPAAGYHYLSWNEAGGSGGLSTFIGAGGDGRQSGLVGSVFR